MSRNYTSNIKSSSLAESLCMTEEEWSDIVEKFNEMEVEAMRGSINIQTDGLVLIPSEFVENMLSGFDELREKGYSYLNILKVLITKYGSVKSNEMISNINTLMEKTMSGIKECDCDECKEKSA